MRAWLRHRTVLAGLGCVLAWGLWTGWQAAAAPGRISPALHAALDRGEMIPRLGVDLGFTPTDFHLSYLQRYGSVAGVAGHRVTLFQVEPADARRLARVFWIRRLDIAGR